MLSSPEVYAGEGDDKMTAERGTNVAVNTLLNGLRSYHWRGCSGNGTKSLYAGKPILRIIEPMPVRSDFNQTYRLFTHFFQS